MIIAVTTSLLFLAGKELLLKNINSGTKPGNKNDPRLIPVVQQPHKHISRYVVSRRYSRAPISPPFFKEGTD